MVAVQACSKALIRAAVKHRLLVNPESEEPTRSRTFQPDPIPEPSTTHSNGACLHLRNRGKQYTSVCGRRRRVRASMDAALFGLNGCRNQGILFGMRLLTFFWTP